MPDTFPPGLRVRIHAGGDGDPILPNRKQFPDDPDLSARPFGGVSFTDDRGRNVDEPPEAFTVPSDYPDHHEWFEVVNPSMVVRPAGPADRPWAKQHNLPHAEAFVIHTRNGAYRYRVVHQPDKYDDETGEVADRAGDPTTHVDWFYVCELEGQVD